MLDPKFSKFENFFFDLDGTLWRWTYMLPGAVKTVNQLIKAGKKVRFLTSNVVLSRAGFAKKLRKFGISARPEQVFNSSLSACRLLKGKKVFVVGEGIKEDLRKARIKVSTKNPDTVLVGEDRTVTFGKMASAAMAIDEGAAFYKTAIGGTWLVGNKRWPGAGAIAAAIEATTHQEAELIGKPSDYMIRELRRLRLPPSKTIFIGDETASDIIIGNKLGWATALVLTGNSSREDAQLARGDQKPDWVLDSVADLLK